GLGEPGPGRYPDADDDEVALERLAAREVHALDRSVALERLERGIGTEVDPVGEVDIGPEATEPLADDVLERKARALDQRHVEVLLACRGGDLCADPPGADHRDVAAGIQPLGDRGGVAHASQVMDAVEL